MARSYEQNFLIAVCADTGFLSSMHAVLSSSWPLAVAGCIEVGFVLHVVLVAFLISKVFFLFL